MKRENERERETEKGGREGKRRKEETIRVLYKESYLSKTKKGNGYLRHIKAEYLHYH